MPRLRLVPTIVLCLHCGAHIHMMLALLLLVLLLAARGVVPACPVTLGDRALLLRRELVGVIAWRQQLTSRLADAVVGLGGIH